MLQRATPRGLNMVGDLGPFIHDEKDFDDPEKMRKHAEHLAYHFWIKAGKPDGKSDYFWKRALKDIERQRSCWVDYTKYITSEDI